MNIRRKHLDSVKKQVTEMHDSTSHNTIFIDLYDKNIALRQTRIMY